MDQKLIDLGPEYWSVPDLDGPTEDCVMPEPIRPPDSVGVWHTCSHCGVTFLLSQQSDGKGGWFERWVDDHQHNQMNRARDRMTFGEYRRSRLEEAPLQRFKNFGPIEFINCEEESW